MQFTSDQIVMHVAQAAFLAMCGLRNAGKHDEAIAFTEDLYRVVSPAMHEQLRGMAGGIERIQSSAIKDGYYTITVREDCGDSHYARLSRLQQSQFAKYMPDPHAKRARILSRRTTRELLVENEQLMMLEKPEYAIPLTNPYGK